MRAHVIFISICLLTLAVNVPAEDNSETEAAEAPLPNEDLPILQDRAKSGSDFNVDGTNTDDAGNYDDNQDDNPAEGNEKNYNDDSDDEGNEETYKDENETRENGYDYRNQATKDEDKDGKAEPGESTPEDDEKEKTEGTDFFPDEGGSRVAQGTADSSDAASPADAQRTIFQNAAASATNPQSPEKLNGGALASHNDGASSNQGTAIQGAAAGYPSNEGTMPQLPDLPPLPPASGQSAPSNSNGNSPPLGVGTELKASQMNSLPTLPPLAPLSYSANSLGGQSNLNANAGSLYGKAPSSLSKAQGGDTSYKVPQLPDLPPLPPSNIEAAVPVAYSNINALATNTQPQALKDLPSLFPNSNQAPPVNSAANPSDQTRNGAYQPASSSYQLPNLPPLPDWNGLKPDSQQRQASNFANQGLSASSINSQSPASGSNPSDQTRNGANQPASSSYQLPNLPPLPDWNGLKPDSQQRQASNLANQGLSASSINSQSPASGSNPSDQTRNGANQPASSSYQLPNLPPLPDWNGLKPDSQQRQASNFANQGLSASSINSQSPALGSSAGGAVSLQLPSLPNIPLANALPAQSNGSKDGLGADNQNQGANPPATNGGGQNSALPGLQTLNLGSLVAPGPVLFPFEPTKTKSNSLEFPVQVKPSQTSSFNRNNVNYQTWLRLRTTLSPFGGFGAGGVVSTLRTSPTDPPQISLDDEGQASEDEEAKHADETAVSEDDHEREGPQHHDDGSYQYNDDDLGAQSKQVDEGETVDKAGEATSDKDGNTDYSEEDYYGKGKEEAEGAGQKSFQSQYEDPGHNVLEEPKNDGEPWTDNEDAEMGAILVTTTLKTKAPNKPTNMVLFYTWLILVVLIAVVAISTCKSRIVGLFNWSKKTSSHQRQPEEGKRLLEHEFV